MANRDAPNGFTLVGHLMGPGHSARVRAYSVNTTHTQLFVGDAVKSSGTGESGFDNLPGVLVASAGNTVRGVLVGIKIQPATAATIHPGYLPTNTGGIVHVCDDPYAIFEAQEDSDSANLALTDIGATTDHVAGSGDTTTAASGHEIDSDGTANEGLVILGLAPREENAVGANARWLVMWKEHELRGAITAT